MRARSGPPVAVLIDDHWTDGLGRRAVHTLGIGHIRTRDALHATPARRAALRLCLTCLASKSALTHPRCHTVDPFPLTAKSPPLVAPRSLRPKPRRSPKTSADGTNSAPPRTSLWPMSHTSCTALRKSGPWERLLLDIGSIKLFS